MKGRTLLKNSSLGLGIAAIPGIGAYQKLTQTKDKSFEPPQDAIVYNREFYHEGFNAGAMNGMMQAIR